MNPLFLFLLDSLPPDRFFGIDEQALAQAAFNALGVIVLGIILTWLLYKPVRSFLRERTQRIQNQMDEARESRAAAGELRAKYDHQLKDIDVERTSILEEARKQASEQRAHILSIAKDEAKDLTDKAGIEIAAERERVRDELHTAVIDISLEMAEKLLAASIDKKAHERLFTEGLAELDRAVFSA
ncbi:MAG: F0F1 ATP synthase subunit B [Defluviitaleaceae bacterium]|nr:F0F1 ATP synthase subunit B [Defluviitaleaceae bacterium]